MKRTRPLPIVFALVLAAMPAVQSRQGQQNAPHVGYVYPAGGQQGTTLRVTVGGRLLDGASEVRFSGKGVQARVLEHDKPLPQREIAGLRQRLQELQKKGADPAARTEAAAIRLRIGDSLRRNANPVLSEKITLEVSIAADAAPGPRRLIIDTTLGLSNPLIFCVGQMPEFREIENKTSPADAELTVTLPATVNGRMIPGDTDRQQAPVRQPPQYMPGDADRYRFAARAGQELVAVVSARDLMPYLADAVPGWFQATLTLFDAAGRELAYVDDYQFRPDPVLHYRIPADGEYVVEVRDALYRGREDFVYRVSIGELPFVTAAYPLGGMAGARTRVEVVGWNLPPDSRTLDLTYQEAGVYEVSLRNGKLHSNTWSFAVDTVPESREREGNDAPKQAQRVTLPVIINGRIQEPGDTDVYSFTGRAGDRVICEITARRLGSPLDSLLELTDARSRRLALNDDHEDRAAALITHQADSLLAATLPADGTYLVRVGDSQHKGGPAYGYRLRLSRPRPDFDLRVSPAVVSPSAGGTVVLTAHALRKDGFSGDIVVALRDAPPGFVLSGGVVPAGQNDVRLTLTVPPNARREPLALGLEGRALVEGRTIERRAVAAEDMMQAFAYRHLVPIGDLQVSVVARGATRVTSRLLSRQPLGIPAGGNAEVRVSIPPAYRTFENVQFELSDPPEGITLQDLSLGLAGAEFVLRADREKARPGQRGTLIVKVSGERAPAALSRQASAAKPQGQAQPAPPSQPPAPVRRRVEVGTLPAIQFVIVASVISSKRWTW